MVKTTFSNYLKQYKNKLNLTIGEVSLIKKIGEGGNGVVYKCHVQENEIAIKFLLSDSSGNTFEQKKTRFLSEYFNVATLDNSKGIVKYIDFDIISIEDENGEIIVIPIILMKLYEKSLSNNKATTQDEVLTLLDFLLDTIEIIHEQGIIHRDIKPENILISDQTYALADFGIANYNPEIFKIRAITDKKERLGNRLFSAPEQELNGVKAHQTMDIYAIGQILHWYVFGVTHRGTNRKRISTIFNDLTHFDSLIDVCLSNEPENRFQSIKEIKEFLNNKGEKRKDLWAYLYDFGEVLVSNFPKNEYGIIHSDNPKKIDRLFQSFKDNEDKFDNNLWWHDGLGNIDFQLTKKGTCQWKFRNKEFSILELWIHYDSSFFNDFIIMHYDKGTPFIIDGKETFYTAIVDKKHHISYSEYENGYAEINDDVVNLTNHNVEFIDRQKKEGYLIIATRFHCALRTKNDRTVIAFLDKLKENNGKLEWKEFEEFEWEIRKNKMTKIIQEL